MRASGTSLLSIVCVGISCLASAASAQSTAGAFQIGLSTSVLSYETGTLEAERDPLELEADISTLEWGINSDVTLELGYGIGDMLVVGGFVQLGGTSQDIEYDDADGLDSDESDIEISIGPKLDIMLSPNSSVRPFFTAAVGIAHRGSDDGDTETTLTGIQLGARAGVRAFLADGFSLDPALVVGWSGAWGELDLTGDDADLSANTFNVGLQLGVSGWL